MRTSAEVNVETLGQEIERKLLNELQLAPVEKFDKLHDLRNLKGESTGYIKVVGGGRIEKGSSLSIEIAPGMRYFNIHIIPDAGYLAPRFLFEGMLSGYGSQVSLDLFPDVDAEMDIDYLIDEFGAVTEIYDEARHDDQLDLRPSRYMHMRAFASPFFVCAFNVQEPALPRLEGYANRYFEEWRKLLESAKPLKADDAAARRVRRSHVAHTLIRQDPDRDKVVDVYGESVTQAIEEASML